MVTKGHTYITQHIFSIFARLELWPKCTLSLMFFEGFSKKSSFKVHLKKTASLLERIPTKKLQRQLNLKWCAFSQKENMEKHISSQQNYVQTNCSNVAPMFFRREILHKEKFICISINRFISLIYSFIYLFDLFWLFLWT